MNDKSGTATGSPSGPGKLEEGAEVLASEGEARQGREASMSSDARRCPECGGMGWRLVENALSLCPRGCKLQPLPRRGGKAKSGGAGYGRRSNFFPLLVAGVDALAHALGVKRICDLEGCWEHQIDERWWVAVNDHSQPKRCSHGPRVAPHATYFELDGCPFGIVDGDGDWTAAGASANEEALLALDSRKDALLAAGLSEEELFAAGLSEQARFFAAFSGQARDDALLLGGLRNALSAALTAAAGRKNG